MSDMMAALGPEDLGAFMEPPGANSVMCRVCDVTIDAETGDPLEPVTQDAVSAVQEYLQTSGQAEEGGVALIGDEL